MRQSCEGNKKIQILKLHCNKNKPIQIRLPENIQNEQTLIQFIDALINKYHLKKQAKFYLWDHISSSFSGQNRCKSKNTLKGNQLLDQQLNNTNKKKNKNKLNSLQALNQLGININRICTQKTPTNKNMANKNQTYLKQKKQSSKTSCNKKTKSFYQDCKNDAMKDNVGGLWHQQDFSQLFYTGKLKNKKCEKQNKNTSQIYGNKQQVSDFMGKLATYKKHRDQKLVQKLATQISDDKFTASNQNNNNQEQQTKLLSQRQSDKKQQHLVQIFQIQNKQSLISQTPNFYTHQSNHSMKTYSFQDLQKQIQNQVQRIKLQRKIKKLYPQLSSIFYIIKPHLTNIHTIKSYVDPSLSDCLLNLFQSIPYKSISKIQFDQFIKLILQKNANKLLNLLK